MVILILKCLEFFLICGRVFFIHSAGHGGESCPIHGWQLVAPTELCSGNPDDSECSHSAECCHASQLPLSRPSLCLQALLHSSLWQSPTHSFLNTGLESAVDKPFPSSFPVWSPTVQRNCSFSCFAWPCSRREQGGCHAWCADCVYGHGEEEWQGGHQHRYSFSPTSVRAIAALREEKHVTETEGSRLSNGVRTYLLCVELTWGEESIFAVRLNAENGAIFIHLFHKYF